VDTVECRDVARLISTVRDVSADRGEVFLSICDSPTLRGRAGWRRREALLSVDLLRSEHSECAGDQRMTHRVVAVAVVCGFVPFGRLP